jgi:hypothetical protein
MSLNKLKYLIYFLSLCVAMPALSSDLIMKDQFLGDLNDDWFTSGTVAIGTYDYAQKVQLGASSVLARAFYFTQTKINIEFDLERDAIHTFSIKDSSSTILGSLAFSGNLVTVDTNNATPTVVSSTASEYYRYRVAIDTVAGTMDFFATGTTVVSAFVRLAPSKSYTGQIDSINFTNTSSTARVDEIYIYNPNYFIIGDSRSHGIPLWNYHPKFRTSSVDVNQYLTYPGYHWSQKSPTKFMATCGFGGSISAWVLSALQAGIIDSNAKKVIVMVGTNDITADTEASAIIVTTESIIDTLTAGGVSAADIYMVDIAPANGWDESQNTELDIFNDQLLPALCVTKGCNLVPIHDLMEDPDNPGDILPAFNEDDTHFTSVGNEFLIDQILKAAGDGGTVSSNVIYSNLVMGNP